MSLCPKGSFSAQGLKHKEKFSVETRKKTSLCLIFRGNLESPGNHTSDFVCIRYFLEGWLEKGRPILNVGSIAHGKGLWSHRKEKSRWLLAVIILCFLTIEEMWPAASCSSPPVFFIMVCCPLQLWVAWTIIPSDILAKVTMLRTGTAVNTLR